MQSSRLKIAQLRRTHHVAVVLKARTLIAHAGREGVHQSDRNQGWRPAAPGRAHRHVAAWLAQLLDAEAACKLAVYLHGMAGDLAGGRERRLMTAATSPAVSDAIAGLTARRKTSAVSRTRRETGREIADCRLQISD
jgi:NAD(P)H-hydrate repair Nnr-like enzyme with NAD(P)H-hydrate dehydratase domain